MNHNLLEDILHRLNSRRGVFFGLMIVVALLAFEIFNYTTTDYAFSDLIGNPTFLGIQWATILAIAFCGIDFAGITRLFTPEGGQGESSETWYLFGAWLIAATMNAILTWWGVSLAVLQHETLGNAIVDRATLIRVVPIFIAIMVWLIRVLILGTFSLAGDRLFSQSDTNQVDGAKIRQKEEYSSPVPESIRYNPIPEAHAFEGNKGSSRKSPRPYREPTYVPRSAALAGADIQERQKELF